MPVSALMCPVGVVGRPGSVVSGGIARGRVPASSRSRILCVTVFLSTCRPLHALSVAPVHLAHDLVDATDGGANARGGLNIRPGYRRAIGAAEDRPEHLVDGVAEMIAQLLQPIQLHRRTVTSVWSASAWRSASSRVRIS